MTVTAEKKKFRLKYYGNYLLLAAVLLLLIVLDVSGVLKRSSALTFTRIGYSIILAVSLNLVVGFLGELSLGHAGFMCVGAYIGCLTSNYLYTVIDSPVIVVLLALAVGGMAAALFGFLIGLPTLRLKGDYLAIVTLAFGEIIRTVCRNQEFLGGAMGLDNPNKYGKELYIIAFLAALVTVAVIQNLMRSKHGRAIQAIRDNEIAARAMGVNVTYYKLVGFVIAAFFAGIAGVIYGQQVSPISSNAFDYNYSIDILLMVVLGGMGNITGSIIAASLLTYIDVTLVSQLSGNAVMYKSLIYALILIFMILWNNAPFMLPARDWVRGKFTDLRRALFRRRAAESEGEPPATAAWDKIPTKIPMDALLSTDIVPERSHGGERKEDENESMGS